MLRAPFVAPVANIKSRREEIAYDGATCRLMEARLWPLGRKSSGVYIGAFPRRTKHILILGILGSIYSGRFACSRFSATSTHCQWVRKGI
jgi:hypothetical protein